MSRQGIPILKPDEDLTAHFRDEAVDDPPRDNTPGPDGAGAPPRGTAASASHSAKMPLRRNRAGIRLLDANTDLRDCFMSPSDEALSEATPDPGQLADTGQHTRTLPVDIPTDRHGIPRLDDQADLHRLFDADPDEAEDAQALGDALQRSLDHDARGLMKQKSGGFFAPRRLSLKEQLRRYPPPQAQLDLHGATAVKARERAAQFIRASRANGLFTLRVIVGKGLHSEAGAVLPDVIEDLLVALKRENLVLSYRWDKRIKRKSGAVVVYLATDFP